jgi:hypothetical protein
MGEFTRHDRFITTKLNRGRRSQFVEMHVKYEQAPSPMHPYIQGPQNCCGYPRTDVMQMRRIGKAPVGIQQAVLTQSDHNPGAANP